MDIPEDLSPVEEEDMEEDGLSRMNSSAREKLPMRNMVMNKLELRNVNG
jgi:hypothetical protein